MRDPKLPSCVQLWLLDPKPDTDAAALRDLIAAAEERGRRRGVEERDELRAIVREVRPLVYETFLAADAMTERAWERFLARIDAALAPRDSTPADDGCCKTCNSINGTHQSWCTSFKAPRDSGKGFSNADEPFADLVAAKARK